MRGTAAAQGLRVLLLVSGLLAGDAAAGAGPPADLLPGLAGAVARREYEATPNAFGLQAPNRAHGLRTYFEPTGLRVHDRTASGSPELLALTLSGVGRGSRLAPVAPGALRHAGARVEIRREGLLEWYENSEAGLEQGFTLAGRPAGEGALALELALAGAMASAQAGDLVFATAPGRRLRYGALHAVDASGRALTAHFEVLAPGRVRIAVDDAGAAYPVTIDPLLTQSADAILDSNQDHANLGTQVAGAGDVNGDGYADVIVSATFYDDGQTDEGAAFVFHGGPGGIASGGPLTAAAKITTDQAFANLESVASAGDVNGDGYADVIVGAHAYNAGQGTLEGVAMLFLGGPSGVGNGSPANADALLESNQGGSWFGVSVAGVGDVNGDGYADVAVGAHQYDGKGAVFVFHGSASGIASGNPATADTTLASAQAGGAFGLRVAAAGDVNADGYGDLIVGADAYDHPEVDEGAAFLYLGSASGIADGGPDTAAAVLDSDQPGAALGRGVAGAGDVNGDGYADVIVGAYAYDSGGTDAGAAFVFHGGASGLASGNVGSAAATLVSNQALAELGRSVAGAGDVNGDGYADVIVGAYQYDDGETDEGLALVFLGGPSGVGNGNPGTAFARLTPNQGGAQLGLGVAGAGDVNGDGYADVLAGAFGYDAGNANEGAAFVYLGGGRGIVNGNAATAAARFESDQATAPRFGWSVASAGDVNGDGYGDVIVGAPLYDSGESDEGAAFVFHGGASGIASGNPASAATRLQANQAGAFFGNSVASAGDVNGDGYGDVIVGAPYFYTGEVQEGGAFVFLGSASGIADGHPGSAATRIAGNQTSALLGSSVASAGDVNGDGYGDVIVGAQLYDSGQTDEGAAFVFLGSQSGIADADPATAATRLESDQGGANLGWSVASAGDVNGDGFADVIVGARYYDAPENDEGAAFVFHGGASGIANGSPASAAARLESDQADAYLGISVASAGDVNGDGYGDVIVGAYRYSDGHGSEGAAFVFHGSASGVGDGNPVNADTRLEGNQTAALLGSSVSTAGDVNGDGYADLIVGANGYDSGDTDEGAAFVFLGSASGIPDGGPATASARLESDQTNADFGYSVASAGDVNGDGFADVIVGANGYDADQTDEGAAFLFYGNGNHTGKLVQVRQFYGGPIQPWGVSKDSNSFGIGMVTSHPQGRGLVKLQWQSCPAGAAFGAPACVTQALSVWNNAGASLSLLIVVPNLPDTLWRWRARVLYAQPSAGADPPNPAHGPWRRLQAQAFEGDIRSAHDFDGDGDGDPIDVDDDNDGLSDAAELALGSNPLDTDTDDDMVLDGPDNCPLVGNTAQTNSDAFVAGDLCQCGDVLGDGTLNAADYQRAREWVVNPIGGPFHPERCDVNGDSACDVADLAVLQRAVSGAGTVVNACEAYLAP